MVPPTASYHIVFRGLIGLYLIYRTFQRHHSALKKRPRDLCHPLMRTQSEGYLWPPATWPYSFSQPSRVCTVRATPSSFSLLTARALPFWLSPLTFPPPPQTRPENLEPLDQFPCPVYLGPNSSNHSCATDHVLAAHCPLLSTQSCSGAIICPQLTTSSCSPLPGSLDVTVTPLPIPFPIQQGYTLNSQPCIPALSAGVQSLVPTWMRHGESRG